MVAFRSAKGRFGFRQIATPAAACAEDFERILDRPRPQIVDLRFSRSFFRIIGQTFAVLGNELASRCGECA